MAVAGTMRFLLLVYRMPMKPASARVAIWRQLKKLGAVYPQQSACIFPDSAAVGKELRPVLQKIEDSNGEYHLLPLRKLSDEENAKIVALFVDQSAKHYTEIIENCEVNFTKEVEFETFRENFTYEEAEEIRNEFEKIVSWFERVKDRDWFNAPNRGEAEQWLARCEKMLETFESRVYESQAQDGIPDGVVARSIRRSTRVTPMRRGAKVHDSAKDSLKRAN